MLSVVSGSASDAIATRKMNQRAKRANAKKKTGLSSRFGAHGESVRRCRAEKILVRERTNSTRKSLIRKLLFDASKKGEAGFLLKKPCALKPRAGFSHTRNGFLQEKFLK
jgi:hypothetical protein